MSMGPVLAAALAWSAEAAAQEPEKLETSGAVVARVSAIAGVIDPDLDVRYQDLWGQGWGLAFETDLMLPLKKSWSIGAYVSAGVDLFEGESDRDDFGDTLDADDLLTTSVLLGFKVMRLQEHGFFFDARLGFGPVFWSAAEGDLTSGGTTSSVTIFDPSVSFAGELAVHIGYSARRVYFAFGFAGRSQGEPEEADLDFQGTSAALVGALELEVGFRF